MLRLIASVVVLIVPFCGVIYAQNLPLPPLPYAYDALEPYIGTSLDRFALAISFLAEPAGKSQHGCQSQLTSNAITRRRGYYARAPFEAP